MTTLSGRILYKTEFEKGVLISNFEKRGWERAEEGDEWNFFWASKGTTRQMFNPSAPTAAASASAGTPVPAAGAGSGSGGAAVAASTAAAASGGDSGGVTAGVGEAPVRVRLRDNQMINHFPNHGELTRKDTLAKNCKRCVAVYRYAIAAVSLGGG